jgi:cytochrome c-type biogenesis protein CcmH/NrfG
VRPKLFPKFAICIGLIAMTWAVFGQTLRFSFVNYDDPVYVSENPKILAGLNWQSAGWAFTHVHSHNWHPLTTMSHMLDDRVFGPRPGPQHFINVLLHSISAVLLFLLLEQIALRLWSSAFVAAVFAIHPLHVESVAWISERKDVLSGLFFMLTLLAYVRYTRRPGIVRYLTMSFWFVCGLLSKPMLVTLPMVLLLLDYWPLRRLERTENRAQSANLLVEKVPLFILSLASSIATLIAQRGGIIEMAHLSLGWRMENALSAYLIYIWQMFWPINMAVIYPHPGRLPFWLVAGASALLVLISTVAILLRKERPYLIVGWLWYIIMLVPVIGLIQVGSQAHADRYTYLSEIGLYWAIVWAVADLLQPLRYRREILASVAPIIIAALGWRAWIQTSYWSNTERLWDRTLAVTGQNDFAHFALGEFMLKVRRWDEAIAQFKIVLASHPNDADANFQMGYALMEKDDLEAAISHFETTLQAKPENPDAETNLGNLLLKAGRIEDAVKHYRIVVRHEPSSPLAHYNLAVGLHRLGRLPEAIAQYKEALALDPKYPDAKEFLEQALLQNGQQDDSASTSPKH